MKKPTINFTKAKENLASQIGAYALVALIATALVAYFVVTPLVRRANRDAKEAGVYRDRTAALEELEEATKTLKRNYELVSVSRDNVLRMVPAGTDEAQLINILFKTAQINGVSLGSYSPESNTQIAGGGAVTTTQSQQPNTTGYTFSVSAVSTYEQMKKFIRDLENGPRLMQIQQVQFSSETAGISSGDTVSVLLLITADYQNSELPTKLTEIKKPAESDPADETEDPGADNTNETAE